MAMDAIRDAIMSGDRSEETFAGLELPETYRAATVHKDEIEMFAGMKSRDKDPRQSLHIDEVPIPELAPDEALVAVMASAINYNTVWTSIFEPVPTRSRRTSSTGRTRRSPPTVRSRSGSPSSAPEPPRLTSRCRCDAGCPAETSPSTSARRTR